MTQAAGMPCPVCAVPLVMSDRQGVEIDYCPQCRGVWVERRGPDLCRGGGRQGACLAILPLPAGPVRRPAMSGFHLRAADNDGKSR